MFIEPHITDTNRGLGTRRRGQEIFTEQTGLVENEVQQKYELFTSGTTKYSMKLFKHLISVLYIIVYGTNQEP
jgi:hypothetical protein